MKLSEIGTGKVREDELNTRLRYDMGYLYGPAWVSL